jgi:hypothetical protein
MCAQVKSGAVKLVVWGPRWILLLLPSIGWGQSDLPACRGADVSAWTDCYGTTNLPGGKYVGEFRDGRPSGQGSLESLFGDKYRGNVLDGNAHGQGTYTFANGDEFVGGFKNGKFHGYGIHHFADGRPAQEKYFSDGLLIPTERIPAIGRSIAQQDRDESNLIGEVNQNVVASQANVSAARKKCEDLGLSLKTEKFGECVLKLSLGRR